MAWPVLRSPPAPPAPPGPCTLRRACLLMLGFPDAEVGTPPANPEWLFALCAISLASRDAGVTPPRDLNTDRPGQHDQKYKGDTKTESGAEIVYEGPKNGAARTCQTKIRRGTSGPVRPVGRTGSLVCRTATGLPERMTNPSDGSPVAVPGHVPS